MPRCSYRKGVAFPDLKGLGTSNIRSSLDKVNGNVSLAAKPESDSAMFIVSPCPKYCLFWVPGSMQGGVWGIWQCSTADGACTGPCSREAAVGEHQQAPACTALAEQAQHHHVWEGSEQLWASQVLAGERTGVRYEAQGGRGQVEIFTQDMW